MTLANVGDVKNNFSRYLRLLEAGEEVVICRHNQPIARLVRIETGTVSHTVLGWAVGEGAIEDDLQGPFIPPSDWEMLDPQAS